MANHEHVEVLIDGVHRERSRRVRARRQYIRFAANSNDIRGMSAACTLAMEGVNRSSLERPDRILDESRFVECVGMYRDLNIQLVCYSQAAIDRGGCRSPILVQFEAAGAGKDLLPQWLRRRAIAFAKKAQVHRVFIRRFE